MTGTVVRIYFLSYESGQSMKYNEDIALWVKYITLYYNIRIIYKDSIVLE